MNRYYYLGADRKPQGPIMPNQCAQFRITAQTPVCPVGGSQWIPAGNIPELQPYLSGGYGHNNQAQQQLQQQELKIQQQRQQIQQMQQQVEINKLKEQLEMQQQQNYVPTPPPNSNMVWAVLSTIFCCLPLGIVAIVKASNVNSAWNSGQYDLAYKNSEDAKKWSIYALVAGFASMILYSILL